MIRNNLWPRDDKDSQVKTLWRLRLNHDYKVDVAVRDQAKDLYELTPHQKVEGVVSYVVTYEHLIANFEKVPT